MTYPQELTTSLWVDEIDGLDYKGRVAAIATLQRRMTAGAVRETFTTVLGWCDKKDKKLIARIDAAIAAVPVPEDYV